MTRRRKDARVYLDDICVAIDRIAAYTATGKAAFLREEMIQDAVIRQLSIIGEAARRVPKSLHTRTSRARELKS